MGRHLVFVEGDHQPIGADVPVAIVLRRRIRAVLLGIKTDVAFAQFRFAIVGNNLQVVRAGGEKLVETDFLSPVEVVIEGQAFCPSFSKFLPKDSLLTFRKKMVIIYLNVITLYYYGTNTRP